VKFKSDKVKVWPGNWFGYEFAWNPTFQEAMKAAIPMRAWDSHSKLWWIPDIYSHIVETIAVEHRVLRDDQLVDVRQFRGAEYAKGTDSMKAAMTTLGLAYGKGIVIPLALVQRAWAYWESTMAGFPSTAADLEKKREAYAFILAEYERKGTLVEVLGRAAP
jgi:hypothetical protein